MVELLAPAGSYEALEAAIKAGADAIYVGGNRFNARAYAKNFNLDELKKAVIYCHQNYVKLYVTINTLYYDYEFKELYDYLFELYELQVDALIVQDEGLMTFIKHYFPDFEIHASTQCSVHSLDGVKHYENKGCSRVVVARENTLDEIKYIAENSNAEIEVFVHGALCVCYSGQCLMSKYIGDRSANRGQCAQPCRLTYTLFRNDEVIKDKCHLLSTKDLCTIEYIEELIASNAKSFKIEGRMKKPEYVYEVVSSYRKAINAALQKQKYREIKQQVGELKQLFNRDFTYGYLKKENQIVSTEYPGNRGVACAIVIGYDKKNKRLKLKSTSTIKQQDGIRFGYSDDGLLLNKIYINNKLVNQVDTHHIFEIDYSKPVQEKTIVYKTTSIEQTKKINHQLVNNQYKHPLSLTLKANINEPIHLTITDGYYSISVLSKDVLEKADKSPISTEKVYQQLSKLGQTNYFVSSIDIQWPDDAFISLKVINQIRRDAILQLQTLLAQTKIHHQKPIPYDYKLTMKHQCLANSLYISCLNLNQLELLLSSNATIIYPINETFEQARKLCIKNNLKIIGSLPTIIKDSEYPYFDKLIQDLNIQDIACNNVASFERYGDKVSLILSHVNILNTYSLNQSHVPCVLSTELDFNQTKLLLNSNPNAISYSYGYLESMIMEYCPISYSIYNKKIPHCNQCKKGKYTLVDRMNVSFPIVCDSLCRTYILYPQCRKFKALNNPMFLSFTIESEEEILKILKQYHV